MVIGILADPERTKEGACMYCSTTSIAFGPLFADRAELEAFLLWRSRHPDFQAADLRKLSPGTLYDLYIKFLSDTGRLA
jgi:hypothetical protein